MALPTLRPTSTNLPALAHQTPAVQPSIAECSSCSSKLTWCPCCGMAMVRSYLSKNEVQELIAKALEDKSAKDTIQLAEDIASRAAWIEAWYQEIISQSPRTQAIAGLVKGLTETVLESIYYRTFSVLSLQLKGFQTQDVERAGMDYAKRALVPKTTEQVKEEYRSLGYEEGFNDGCVYEREKLEGLASRFTPS